MIHFNRTFYIRSSFLNYTGIVRMLLFSLLILANSLFITVQGQGIIPTKGKEFWMGFPTQNNYQANSKRCELFIASEYNTSGIVIVPQQGWSMPFTVVANQTTTLTLPLAIVELFSSQTVESKGVLIQTLDTVSVFAISFQQYTADATVIYPVQSLGTEYRITSYQGLAGAPSQFLVVATQDDTQFTITTTASTMSGNAAGVPFVVNLDAGESYQVRANATTGDFTGSTIIGTDSSGSCRPFAVFSSTTCVNVPVGCTWCDMLFDQALPVTHWGKTYYSTPFAFTTKYTLRILADQNNTWFTVDGGAPINLNAGQFTELNNLTTAKCIVSNKPISVVQYMQGLACAGAGDPAMMYLNAEEQKIDQVTFSTVTSTVITQHNVNVIMNSNHTSQLKLDGVSVPSASFVPFPGCPNISYVQLPLTQGSHTLDADSGFSAYTYGTGSAESYAYSVGSFSKRQPIQVDSILCSSDTIHLGNNIPLFGSWWSTIGAPNDTIFVGQQLTLIPPITPDIYLLHGNEFISGCEKIYYLAVEIPDPPATWASTAANITCQSSLVQLNSGTLPPSPGNIYSWTPAAGLSNPNIANPVLTATTSGWYHVAISTSNGCTPTVYDSVYVEVLPLPPAVINTGGNQTICIGDTANLAVSGGVTYQWMPGGLTGSNISVTPIVNTDYIVHVVDSNGCENSDTVSVFVNPLPAANAGVDVNVCSGSNTILTAGGGVSYLWNPGAIPGNSISVSPIANTNYSVQVTDANGCINYDTVFVSVSPPPLVNAGIDKTICINESTTLTATGGVSYIWNPGNIAGNSISVSPLASSTYSVIATDANGCTASDTVMIVVNPLPAVNAGSNVSICNGATTSLNVNGANNYNWMPGNLSGSSINVSPVNTTTYYVTGTDANGCENVDSVVVVVNPLPVIDAGLQQNICSGDVTSLSASGGISYSWMPGNLTGATISISPISNSTYVVTGTDANGCSNVDSVIVMVNPLPVANAGTDKSVCSGFSATLNASGGVSYLWMPGGSITPSITVTPNNTTNYIVMVTDNNGCENSDTVQVVVNPLPVVNAGSNLSICNGETASLNVNGAATYSWMPGNLSGSGISVSPVNTTTYYVTGTDANGCENVDSVVVVVNPLPVIDAGLQQTVCSGDVTSLSASGGISYNWMPGNFTGATINVYPISTSTYVVTGTDANGCSNVDSVTVMVNPLPVANAGTDKSVCSGFSATLNASGGVSYLWMPGGSNTPSITVTPNNTTNYIVTVTGNNGCENTDTVQVVVNPLPAVSAGIAQGVCIGDTAILNATGAATYVWSPGNYNGAVYSVNPSVTSTYSVTGTDSLGCVNTATVTVAVYSLPVVSVGANQTICEGTTATLTAGGGTGYSWTPGNLNGNTVSVTPVNTTQYTVVVTNANGCTSSGNVTVSVNPLPNANAGVDKYVCPGASATFTATGGVSYLWNPGGISGNVITLTPSVAQNYIVQVTDVNGCMNTDTVYLGIHPLPVSEFSLSAPVCQHTPFTFTNLSSVAQGSITDYNWNFGNGSSSSAMQPGYNYHIPGVYPVTLTILTDAGCMDQVTHDITVNALPVVNFITSDECVNMPVTFTDLSSAAPNQIASWSWNFGDGSVAGTDQNAVHSYNHSGYFDVTLTVEDDSGCVASKYQPQALFVHPLPEALFRYSPEKISILDPKVNFFDESILADAWYWNFGDGVGQSDIPNPVYVYSDTGSYSVRLIVTSVEGCLDTIFGEVIIDPFYTVFIPNAFTPNGDGVNEEFIASGIGIHDFEMVIFDRWGKVVFSAANINESWNGKSSSGTECMQGTYVYKIRLKDFNDERRELVGHVNLVR